MLLRWMSRCDGGRGGEIGAGNRNVNRNENVNGNGPYREMGR